MPKPARVPRKRVSEKGTTREEFLKPGTKSTKKKDSGAGKSGARAESSDSKKKAKKKPSKRQKLNAKKAAKPAKKKSVKKK